MAVQLFITSCLLICNVIRTRSETIYDRPFHLTYANLGGKALADSDEDILAAFANMPVRPTMALQVILNKLDLTKGANPVEPFVLKFKQIVPNMCFGAGRGNKINDGRGAFVQDQADWDWYMERAASWKQYTNCISLEAFDILVDNTPEEIIRNFLTELHDKHGFNHIVANPWRPSESGDPWPYIDAAWIGIRQVDTKQYGAWHPRINRAQTIMENNANIRVMMNYENAPGHIALALLGNEGSCQAMQLAVDDQRASAGSVDFFWAPPWTSNYDPLIVGSWDWIQATYAELYGESESEAAAGMFLGAVEAEGEAEGFSLVSVKSLVSVGLCFIVGVVLINVIMWWVCGYCRKKKQWGQEDESDAEEIGLL